MENYNLGDVESIGLESNHESKLKFEAKCINEKLATLACNNPNCTEYAFVCEDKQCECRKKHKKCLLTDVEQIIQLIEDKKGESKDVIDKISNVLEDWIDEISKTRQKIQTQLKNWGLSSAEKAFINLLKTKNYNKLTGNHVNQITTKTVEYFTEETKQRLFSQIEVISKNYDAQIQSIMKAVTSLFDKYVIDDKENGFKDINEVQIEPQQGLIEKVEKMLNSLKQPYQKKNYDQFVIFFKETLKEDFTRHMKKYKQSRRVYGSKKLRQKYFEDYFAALNKGEYYIKKWQLNLKEQLVLLAKSGETKLNEFGQFYRESDGTIEKPFLPEASLSLQKTINTIYLLVDFVKVNGKRMIQWLYDKNKRLTEKFEVTMFFLDGLMDEHPQIDEIENVWNIMRFEQKLKSEVNYLFETIEETLKDPYELEIKCMKSEL